MTPKKKVTHFLSVSHDTLNNSPISSKMRFPPTIFLLSSLPLLTLSLPSSTSTTLLNTTHLNPLLLNPLPNPYPIPNSPITLDFAPLPLTPPPLSPTDLTSLITLLTTHFDTLISAKGDQPIARRIRQIVGSVSVKFYSGDIPIQRMTYSEAVAVLGGFGLKMEREGFVRREARVLETGSGDVLGVVVVSRVQG
ncbi:hypothetical protein BDR22DRAFT_908836 [Usnea florida]